MNIQTLVHSIQNIGASGKASSQKHPRRDWVILVSTTLILFLVIALGTYILFQIQISTDAPSNSTEKVPELKTTSVETVQAIFEKRAQVRGEYQSSRHFIDPLR